MENYELNIEAPPRRKNNWFPKGHKPFNKGVPMANWMDGRKIRKVKKYLELGRKEGNKDLPGKNRIPIVGIKDGKLSAFSSATEAAKILKAKGIKVNCRNICAVIHQKQVKNGNYSYIRMKAGGYRWFIADQVEKYKDLIIS